MGVEGTEKIYSTFTPRSSRIEGIDRVVFFGLQGFIKEYLIEYFNEQFFNKNKEVVVNDYKRIIENTLGKQSATTEHIEALHDLGYLPIKICALPEGSLVPIRCPMFTIENTHKDFYWLTNFLETLISACVWKPCTSTTIVKQYRDICEEWAERTAETKNFIDFQCHNFSYRGMHSNEDGIVCGAGHMLYFKGSDTIPSIQYLENHYNASVENEIVGVSCYASEHSIQCQYQDDYTYFKNLITKVIPNGLVSIVADGYDYWGVFKNVIPKLKEDIMKRDGKVVIRADSGVPADILCGDPYSNDPLIQKGSVEALWDLFGGTINDKGYKVLDPHIGIIYGEAITPEVLKEIFTRLEVKGFSCENVVVGVGSYGIGHHTRDTFGMAIKATYTIVDGKETFIFKDPKTDTSKMKKSQTGKVAVFESEGKLIWQDHLFQYQKDELAGIDLLQEIFVDGKLLRDQTLQDIRSRANASYCKM
jgi:nicotinamide phosphoribosyltransferase